jgi:hypothetical protein
MSASRQSRYCMMQGSHLFVLQTHQQYLFHEGQFGLLASFGTFANVAGVKGDLVSIGRALVGCFGTPSGLLRSLGWYGRADSGSVVVVGDCPCTTSPPCEARGGGHVELQKRHVESLTDYAMYVREVELGQGDVTQGVRGQSKS